MLEGAEFSWEAGVLRLHPSSCMRCSCQEHTVLGTVLRKFGQDLFARQGAPAGTRTPQVPQPWPCH